jgi:hypothetical protein
MKEIMTLLLNMVVEQEEDEDDEDFATYPGMATTSDFKTNN